MSEETRQKAASAVCDAAIDESLGYAEVAVDALTAHIMDEVRTCKQDLQVAPAPPACAPPENTDDDEEPTEAQEMYAYDLHRIAEWMTWARDVCADFKESHDDHDVSLRHAIGRIIHRFKGATVPPAAEGMSEDAFARSVEYWQSQGAERLCDEAARARESEAELIRNYASQSAYVGKANERIAALEFGRDGLISERDGLKVAHKVLEKAIDHMNNLIDRKNTRIADMDAERIRLVNDCVRAGKRIAELERSNAAYRDSWKACMDESCAGELHCTCVPGLRERVRVLAGDLATAREDAANAEQRAKQLYEGVPAIKRHLSTARGLLEEWQPAHNWQGVGNPATHSKVCDCDLCESTRAFLAAKEGE